MTRKEMICVVCPNGCQIQAEIEEGEKIRVNEITGHLCDKGPDWAEQELVNPMRTIASSIMVEGGDFPLVSVRTDSPIPLESIPEIMKAVKSTRATAPVQIGDIMVKNPAGTSCKIIATRTVRTQVLP
jgi:CxxC motif-containing protein